MDAPKPAGNNNVRPEDRRRSRRVSLLVPVSLKWVGLDGLPVVAEGRAVEGSDHGGLLEIAEPPPFGKEAALTNLVSHQTIMVQSLSLRTANDGKVRGLAVQFLSLNKEFWGALGVEGSESSEFQAGMASASSSPGPSRWKSLLDTLLGRPRI